MTQIYKDDYVRVDKDGNLVESFDVVYHVSSIDKEEISNAKKYNERFVRMIDLPKKIQAKYLKHFKFMGV
tara:strand:+ start:244 stop:453 length:210 start_codon:yes stop_codon:yes gene_type:complete